MEESAGYHLDIFTKTQTHVFHIIFFRWRGLASKQLVLHSYSLNKMHSGQPNYNKVFLYYTFNTRKKGFLNRVRVSCIYLGQRAKNVVYVIHSLDSVLVVLLLLRVPRLFVYSVK